MSDNGYAIMRASDAPDFSGDSPGAFLGYGRPMGSEQLAVNLRLLEPGQHHAPPGFDQGWGHGHHTIEEIYLVLSGQIRIKLDDDTIETLGPLDAVRLSPGTTRAVRNDSDQKALFAMISVRVEDQQAEARHVEGFWPE
jgi:uncharacterized cupin superfamily protein